MFKKVFFFLTLIFFSSHAYSQSWSGILAPGRAGDWSTVGVAGGIPARTTICTTLGTSGQSSMFAQNVSASQISSAFASCPAGQTVFLNAGTYNISGLHLGANNVTLRGAGASKTILNVNGLSPVSCHIGDGHAVNLCADGGNIGVDSAENTATWNCNDTGGVCAQARTSLVLSGHTNLTVGHTIWLDQTDDSSDTGDIWVRNWGAGESFVRNNRGLLEGHIVTACGTSTPGAACTSNTITISPGLSTPAFRSAKSPGAWWGNSRTILHDSGIENLTIDVTGAGPVGALYLINCTNCWVKGTRLLYRNNVSSGQPRMFAVINGMQVSIVDNYIYGYFASSLVSIYSFAPFIMSGSLFQNNIVHAATNPFVQDSSVWNNVFSYNYTDSGGINSSFSQPSQILHGVAGMNLVEGNDQRNFSSDNIHSSHNFFTLFRNHFSGQAHSSSGTETQAAMALYAASRFFNLIGNVSGNSQWSSYTNSQSPPNHCSGCIYELGWQGTNSNGTAATGNDINVRRTIMQWGNWDSITSTNDNGTNDSTGTRFAGSEVPSGISSYPNPVPSSQSLPASFYLSGRPSWWITPYGTPPWPAIGPDVSGGNINNGTTEPTGGHANAIPARLCFQNAALDPSYGSSSPRIKSFDASTCYAGGPLDLAAPSVPAGLSATSVSSSQINLSWTASTDNVGVAGYRVFRNGTQVGTNPSNSFQDSGLSPATTYSYAVSANDSSGNNSAQSSSASATTQAAATPPVLSNIAVSNVTSTTATISWTTNIAADSQVEYGLTASYGSQSTLDSSLVTSHTRTLSGLSAGATYNFRVKSRETTGSLSTSSNFTFTTTTTAPPPGNPAVPLVYLRFDEGGGTVAADSSGNSLNGTVMGGASFVAGHSGNAVSLNGTTQSVDLGSPTPLQLTGSMTVSAWINSSSFPADDSAIVSGAAIGFQLDTSADTGARRIGFKLSNSQGSMMARYGSSTLTTNTWYYVTGVYNAAAQTLDVYLNGNLDNGTLAGTLTNTQRNPSLIVSVGRRAGTTGLEFAGKIDDVRIYGRALTPVEIVDDMNRTVPPPDTTLPIVSITAPASGSSVSGTSVAVSATASDNIGIAGIQFKLDGANLGTEDTTAPYSITWNASAVSNGSHSLTAVARDAAGNQGTSATVTVTVNNPDITPPTVSLTAPSTGTTVSGPSVTVSANASDAVGVAGVQFLLDGVSLGPEDASAPYSISWDTTSVAGGSHTLAARARDAAGNQTTSPVVTITVPTATLSSALTYLKFDESSGTVALDSSGHGLNGSLVSGPAFVAGKTGNAIALNGSSQYVDLGSPATLQLTGSMSISAWINSSSFPADDSAIVSSGSIGFQLDTSVDTGARRIAFKLSSAQGSMMARYGSTTMVPNTWYYVTGVYNATAKTLDVYLNGILDNGSLAGTVTTTQRIPSLSVSVGRRPGTSGLQFAGKIDDVRIYGRALTPAEIQADMKSVP